MIIFKLSRFLKRTRGGTSTLKSHDKTENNAEQCQLIKKRVNIELKMTTAENNLFGNVNRLQE